MTLNCVEKLAELRETCPEFADLSAEQLIYEAVTGVGVADVKFILNDLQENGWAPPGD